MLEHTLKSHFQKWIESQQEQEKLETWALFLILLLDDISAQRQTDEDSLKKIISLHKEDTAQVNSLSYLASLQANSDTAIIFAKQGLALAQKLHYKKGQADCFFIIAWNKTDFAEAIQNALNALKIYEKLHVASLTEVVAKAINQKIV